MTKTAHDLAREIIKSVLGSQYDREGGDTYIDDVSQAIQQFMEEHNQQNLLSKDDTNLIDCMCKAYWGESNVSAKYEKLDKPFKEEMAKGMKCVVEMLNNRPTPPATDGYYEEFEEAVSQWNTHPTEDNLKAQVASLQEQVEM